MNHQDTPLRITRIEHPEERFTTRLQTLEDGKRYRLTLTLRTDGAAGERRDVLRLHTEDGRVLRVMPHTRVRERVYTFPDQIDLGELPRAAIVRPELLQRAAQTFMVYQVGGTDFRAKVSIDIPGLHISAERGPRGDRWQFTLTLNEALVTVGPIKGSIVIDTNDPEFPRVTVAVSGRILDR